jgi:hypothetical protein
MVRGTWIEFVRPLGPGDDAPVARLAGVNAHVFDTPALRAAGLAGRPGLPADWVALFAFPVRGRYPFTTRTMRFPLDILYIDEDPSELWRRRLGAVFHGVVADVLRDVPPGLARPVGGSAAARWVVEANAGFAARYGITPGVRAGEIVF